MKKQIEILNYIRQRCINGEELTMRLVAKEHRTNNRQLATAEELGYIKKVGRKKYIWKVGEVLPVMAKVMEEKISEYYKKYNSKVKLEVNYKELYETSVEDNRKLVDINRSNLKDIDRLKNANSILSKDIESLKKDNKSLKSIDDTNSKLIHDLRSKIKQMESSKAEWGFVLFGIRLFGTYSK